MAGSAARSAEGLRPPTSAGSDELRSLTSYAKFQALYGRLIRNRRFQLGRGRAAALKYLDIGCGQNVHESLINLDYRWHPGIDVCWNLRRGLPFPDASMLGIFAEHCLEHFGAQEGREILRECRRVLAPRGVLRVIVPDGELYLRTYVERIEGRSKSLFPYEEDRGSGPASLPMTHVNRVFYQDRESLFGHRVMFDYAMLRDRLLEAGFASVQKVAFRQGSCRELLVDSELRRAESLYVEAAK